MRFLNLLVTLAGLTLSASAFTINQPSTSIYWVQFLTNTIAWSNAPNDSPKVTLQIINSNATLLNGVFSIAEYVPASLEAYTVTNVTLVVADGYVLQMVSPTNSSQVYASSTPFSVKSSDTAPAPGSSTSSPSSITNVPGMAGGMPNMTGMNNMTGMSNMPGNSPNGRTSNTTGFTNKPNTTANANAQGSLASTLTPISLAALSVVASTIGLATLATL